MLSAIGEVHQQQRSTGVSVKFKKMNCVFTQRVIGQYAPQPNLQYPNKIIPVSIYCK